MGQLLAHVTRLAIPDLGTMGTLILDSGWAAGGRLTSESKTTIELP